MTAEPSRARLLEDAGAGAEEDEFFRCAAFLAAEGVTHTLRIDGEGGRASIPVIVRSTPDGTHRDAISPYGYPGGKLSLGLTEGGIDVDAIDWSEAAIVSAFLRNPVGSSCGLSGASDRSLVQVSDPELPRKSRMSDRQQIRRNERDGYVVQLRPGPESSEDEVTALTDVYRETMVRANAADRYLYDRDWFATVLRADRTWLFTIGRPDGRPAAAALVVESDAFLHYYLSGTADAHSRSSPSKNLIVAVTDFAEERGQPLNLGGGLKAGDGLEAFKRGFANRELPFRTHELVCDPGVYATLSSGAPQADFFPAYRAPA